MAISFKDAEEMRRMLECPICLERQNTPRQLPCIHTFCEGCIQTFMDKRGENGKFSCPKCNRVIDIPKDGAAGFPFNHFLYHMSDCVPKTTIVFCFVCHHKGSTVEAESMCIQCAHHLCKKCAEVHCQTGLTLTHKVVSLDEVAAGVDFETMRRFQKTYCSNHSGELLKMYCEQCQMPVCILCTKLDHGQHKIKKLEEAAKVEVEVLQGLIEPWVDAVDHAQILSDESRTIREELTEELLAQKRGELCKIYADFKKRIDDALEIKKSEAITNLNEQFHLAQKQTQAAYEEAESSRLSLMSTLRDAKKLVESLHAAETTQQFPDMAATLASLDISQLQQHVERPVFIFTPSELSVPVPDLFVGTEFIVKSQLQPLPKSPAHRVTPQTVANYKNNAVFVSGFFTRGKGEGSSFCTGLAVCDGGIVVTDLQNKNVKVFDKHDFKLKLMSQQDHHKLQSPIDVTCNHKGEIFVTDDSIKGVVRYDTHGRLIKVFPGVYKADGYITCHNQQLVVSDTRGGRVIITDFDLNIRHQLDARTLGLGEFHPRYVCMDNSSQLIVSSCSPKCVYVIDYKRPAVVSTLTDQLSTYPSGVCVDPYGHILVAVPNKNRLFLYNNERAHEITIPGDVERPTGLCITAPGQVSVVERYKGVVKTFQYLEE